MPLDRCGIPLSSANFRDIHGCQRRNNASISTTATPQMRCRCPLQASEIENTDLFDVVVRAVLAANHDHFGSAGAVNVNSDCTLVRVRRRRIVVDCRQGRTSRSEARARRENCSAMSISALRRIFGVNPSPCPRWNVVNVNIRHDFDFRLSILTDLLPCVLRSIAVRDWRHASIANQFIVTQSTHAVEVSRRRDIAESLELGPMPSNQI